MPGELLRRLHATRVAWRWVRYLSGARSPLAADLKVTARCNLRCGHCPWTKKRQPDLETGRWLAIIKEIARRGALYLVLEGGEPTLREDLQTLVMAGKRAGMRVIVATNGARPLWDYTPDRFLVSVDGLEEVHDRLRGPDAFRAMISNLSSARAPRIALVSLCRGNQHQIRALLEYFRNRVEGFWFSFMYDYSGTLAHNGNSCGDGSRALNREEQRDAAGRILGLMPYFRIINTRAFLSQVGTHRPCRPWLMPVFTADGKESGGCVISSEEDGRCDHCELPCHRELSGFTELSGSWDRLRSYCGKTWR